MDKEFRDQVKQSLSDFDYKDIKDICYFAWLCAVRALPFLVLNGNFDYWKNTKEGDQRQNRLLAVLKAIDVAADVAIARADAGSTGAVDFETNTRTAHAYANVARNTAYTADVDIACIDDYYAVASDTYVAASAAAYVAAAADYAAYITAYAAYAELAYTDTGPIALTVATIVARVADYAATAATHNTRTEVYGHVHSLKNIILEDLERIKTNKSDRRKFQNGTAIYGPIWNNFQNALRDIDCEYWGNWYEQMFAKGLSLDVTDLDEIQMRISMPGETMEQGAVDVARYVQGLKKYGEARLDETRVIILGNKGSGKTSLAKRLKNSMAPMPKVDESTEGVDVIDWYIPDDPDRSDGGVNVHVWDFAGHVITHAVHRCFMSERCLYVLVVNGREEAGRIEHWLEQIRNYGGDSPVLILINVMDKHPVDLPKNTLLETFPSIVGFYKADIAAGDASLEAFRQVVVGFLRDQPLWKNQKISVPAYRVKEALQQKFRQGNNFIERRDFDQIAKVNGIKPEEHEQLLDDLHAIGICLWYKDADMGEFSMMVLNPGWISHGIYRLINWGAKQEKFILSISDFREAFKDAATRYPEEKAGFLFKLMATYQLAFFKNKDATEIFVPLLRPIDRPKKCLPDSVDRPKKCLPVFEFGERLRMVYCASQALPPYTVARLAVQHSEEWDIELSWRFGAVLRWNDTVALVEENERARSVTVSVRGPKQTEYISKLRDTLNNIFADYKTSYPKLKCEVLLTSAEVDRADNRLFDDLNIFMHSAVYLFPKVLPLYKASNMYAEVEG